MKKLKQQYITSVISIRVNGVMKTFDANNVLEKDYEYYYNNGFEHCFDEDKPVVKKEIKTIEFKNEDETPIKKTRRSKKKK